MVGSVQFNSLLKFGPGVLSHAVNVLPEGTTAVSLIGAPSFLGSQRGINFVNALETAGITLTIQPVHGEPSPAMVDSIASKLKSAGSQAVIAVGGGSVLDAAKAAAAICFEEGSVKDYLEGVGTKSPSGKTLPVIAVPTTSGTGSEATKNAVISSPARKDASGAAFGFKKSIRHDNYIPVAALLDSDLLVSCPAGVTASCGMDAFSQLLESFLSTKANPVTDALAWDGLTRFLISFPALMEDLGNPELRLHIALGAYYSGITLANAGLGAVHGMAGALGGVIDVPHGAACGTLLYPVFKATADRWDESEALDDAATAARAKMARLGSFLSGKNLPLKDGCDYLLDELKRWQDRYDIPRLSEMGVERGDLSVVAAGGNKNHPYPFTQDERLAILEERF